MVLKATIATLLVWEFLPLVAHADSKPALARMVLDHSRVKAGDTIQATYTFRSTGPAAVDMKVFVHVVRPDGRHIGADFDPDLPTTRWPASGFVREGAFPIAVPVDAAPGTYQVWIGLFSSQGRIELGNPDRLRGHREYCVGEFQVVESGTAAASKRVVFDWLPVDEAQVVRALPPPVPRGVETKTAETSSAEATLCCERTTTCSCPPCGRRRRSSLTAGKVSGEEVRTKTQMITRWSSSARTMVRHEPLARPSSR